MKKKYQTDLSIYMQMRYDPQFDQLKEKIFTTQVPTPLYIPLIQRWTVILISLQNHPIRPIALDHSHSHFQVKNI
jgi:hypothetical protein